jgi:catechol-2,3-dioxygenase
MNWEDGRGRSLYVEDPDGNVVELWSWDVAEHLRLVE